MEVRILNKHSLLIIILLCIASTALFADVKIAYVNTERIFSELKEVQEAQQLLNSEIQTWEKELQELEKELTDLKTEYEEKKLILTQASKDEAEGKISELETTIQNKYTEIYGENGKIVNSNNDLLKPVMEKLKKAIEKVAVDNNYTMVFDSSGGGVLYAKPTVDITDDVIDAMKEIKESINSEDK